MDRIVWNSAVVGDLTDRLRLVLRHLEDEEEVLQEVSSSLEYAGSGEKDSAVLQINDLLSEVRGMLRSLDEKTVSLRKGMYQSMEMFDSVERQITNRVMRTGVQNDGQGTRSTQGAETSEPKTTVVMASMHTGVNPDWLVNLASDTQRTKRG